MENNNGSGFSTASGAKIGVSKEALAKAKKLFQEDDDNNSKNDDDEGDIFNDSFEMIQEKKHIETGTKIDIDPEALSKAAAKLFDTATVTPDFQSNGPVQFNTNGEKNVCGFKTASGIKVDIDPEALANAAKLFEDTAEKSDWPTSRKKETVKPYVQSKKSTNGEKDMCGFKTASGIKVDIDPDALVNAAKLFEETDTVEKSGWPISTSTSASNKNVEQVCGFKTASGVKVDIDPDALANAAKLFEDTAEKYDCLPSTKTVKPDFQSKKSTNGEKDLCGFKTASGIKVGIDPKALAKAAKLFEETDTAEQSGRPTSTSTSTSASNKNVEQVCGFQTASGVKVDIDPKALANAAKLFEDTAEKSDCLTSTKTVKPDFQSKKSTSGEKNVCGFKTASGVKVDIDPDALAKAAKLFEETHTPQPTSTSTSVSGFNTSSGVKIDVSKEALAIASNIFKDDDDKGVNNKENYVNQTPAGFKTASGANIDIDEKAVAKVANLFKEEKEEFQGPKVAAAIGKTALLQVAKISEDCGSKTEKCTSKSDDDKVIKEDSFGEDFEYDTQLIQQVERDAEAETMRRKRKMSGDYDGSGQKKSKLEEELVPFKSLDENSCGQTVKSIRYWICRKYPLVFALQDADTKRTTYMSQKAMEKWNDTKEDMEEIYAEVRSEFEQVQWEKNKSKRVKRVTRRSSKDMTKLECGEDINEMIEQSPDPGQVQAMLSPAQRSTWQNFLRSQWEQLHAEMREEVERRMKSRTNKSFAKITPLLRLRVLDQSSGCTGTICVWNPTEELNAMVSEGGSMIAYDLTVGSVRDGEVQFHTGKGTFFQQVGSQQLEDKFRRCLTPLDEIVSTGFQPAFGEVDTVGVVVALDKKDSYKGKFQTVHICDTMHNFVSLQFWGGLADCGYDNLIRTTGVVLLFTNLQWRMSSAKGKYYDQLSSRPASGKPPIPCLYVTEQTLVSMDTWKQDGSRILQDINREVAKDTQGFLDQAKERLAQLTTDKPIPKTPSYSPMPRSTPGTHRKHKELLPLVKSTVEVVPNSPASVQSSKTKERIALLERIPDPPTSPTFPTTTTPLTGRRHATKLKTPFKIPFIQKLNN